MNSTFGKKFIAYLFVLSGIFMGFVIWYMFISRNPSIRAETPLIFYIFYLVILVSISYTVGILIWNKSLGGSGKSKIEYENELLQLKIKNKQLQKQLTESKNTSLNY